MAKFIVIKQSNLTDINIMNKLKMKDMYTVLDKGNGYVTICQYSDKYDNFHIVTVKEENLDKNKRLTSSEDD